MKRIIMVVTAMVIVSTGCEYQVPLADKQDIPVDEAVLGLWEQLPERDAAANPENNMLVLKYTEKEYLVHYPTGKDGMYFRGYPIKIAGKIYMQIQLIGTKDGDIEKKDRKYHVVSYVLSDGQLEIKTLNSELVDKNLQDSAKLTEAFLKNKDNKTLFKDPGKFRRTAKKN